MAFDDVSKQIFKDKFGDAVKTEIKVGVLEKSFDIFINGKHPLIQQSDIIPGLFKLFENNIIEYKSAHDSYRLYELLKLNGDFSYYSFNQKQNIKYALENSCLWFIVANGSSFQKEYVENGFISDGFNKGYYSLPKSNPVIRIIVLEELDSSVKENSLLLLLASAKKFEEFVTELIKNDDLIQELKRYINKKLFIEGREVRETEDVKTLKKKIDYKFEQNIRDSVDDLGVEKVIDAVGLEKLIATVGLEKLITTVGMEKLIAAVGLEKLIAAAGLENIINSLGNDQVDELIKIAQKRQNQRTMHKSKKTKSK